MIKLFGTPTSTGSIWMENLNFPWPSIIWLILKNVDIICDSLVTDELVDSYFKPLPDEIELKL
jgi:hypothetical protein